MQFPLHTIQDREGGGVTLASSNHRSSLECRFICLAVAGTEERNQSPKITLANPPQYQRRAYLFYLIRAVTFLEHSDVAFLLHLKSARPSCEGCVNVRGISVICCRVPHARLKMAFNVVLLADKPGYFFIYLVAPVLYRFILFIQPQLRCTHLYR